MSVQFYNSIIEDEKRLFNVKGDSLKIASKAVSKTYNTKRLKSGLTFLDYNLPSNRCAYLYKYAAAHTDLTAQYFTEIMSHEGVRFLLEHKKELKICCLGGGSGSDVVGLFKALATSPFCHKKITDVTVFDLCGGWRNSFKHIISRLRHGKVEGVPSSFIDSSNFTARLIAVNLLDTLPANVLKIIENADIFSTIKFVSAVIGKKESTKAMRDIAEKMKFGAIVLFIDNSSEKVFWPLVDISHQSGLSLILGPLKASYERSGLKAHNDLYNCRPLLKTHVSVIGWFKTTEKRHLKSASKLNGSFSENPNKICDDDVDWDTDSDSEESFDIRAKAADIMKSHPNEIVTKAYSENFSQTDPNYFLQANLNEVPIEKTKIFNDLLELIKVLSKLIVVLKLKKQNRPCCSHSNNFT